MLHFERATSDPLFRGNFSIVQRGGRWVLRQLGQPDRPIEGSEAQALEVLETAHQTFLALSTCRVYFIGEAAALGLPVKIGFTGQLDKRLRQLRAHSPYRLHVLAATPGDQDDEWDYHQRFASERIHGEWFIANEAILAEIEALRAAA